MADESVADVAPETEATAQTPPISGFAPPTVAMGDENPPEDWSPPQVNEQGFAVDGDGLPLNLRLRAAALADAGRDEDPSGSVSAETIKAEAERLAAYDKAFPTISSSSKTADLERIAKAEGVDISSAANNDERIAIIRAARPSRV
jgi:hypothetical protein